MESKHSKGTWLAKDGEIYVEETGKTIALMTYFDDDNEEQAANAELIAASPILLCELKRMVEYYQHSEIRPEAVGKIRDSLRAIYDATGE